MKRIAFFSCLVALCSLFGCVDERASIVNSAWVCVTEQEELSLYFSEQTCQATTNTTLDGASKPIQLAKGYTYIPPKITFFLADGTQVAGVFYDNYTRLEVASPEFEYSFMRTQ